MTNIKDNEKVKTETNTPKGLGEIILVNDKIIEDDIKSSETTPQEKVKTPAKPRQPETDRRKPKMEVLEEEENKPPTLLIAAIIIGLFIFILNYFTNGNKKANV